MKLDTSKQNKTTREFCGLCGNIVRVGFHVPNEIWKSVVHRSRVNDIHCLDCFTKRADEKLIDWSSDIKFYPVSFRSHRTINFKPKFSLKEKQK